MSEDKHKIVLMNGPPRSGKDTAGEFFKLHHNARLYKMSSPLKEGTLGFLGAVDYGERKWLEDHKEERLEQFGMSYREMQISMSEDWSKKVFGDEIFGKLAVRRLKKATGALFTVVTDSGFLSEAMPLVRFFGASNVLHVKLSRPGCSFEGDSRSHWDPTKLGVRSLELANYYDELEHYHIKLKKEIMPWVML